MSNFSKAKGSAFEAKIRDLLSTELKLKFERVPLSGSIEYLKGDLWTPEDTKAFPYCIECKHYAELDFNSLLTAKSNDIYSFWQQTLDGAARMKKSPLLIFRWNRSKDFAAWDTELNSPHQMHINCFGYKFKMGLLTDWITQYKSSC